MDLSFGTRLRVQRERQNVTLAAIAERTKIRAALLERLERNDVSQWPGGIFRRAYVRAYAQAIGLDPDVVVGEFLERYPDPLEIDIPSASDAASPGKRPPTRLETLIGAAVGSLPPLRSGVGKKAPVAETTPVEAAREPITPSILEDEAGEPPRAADAHAQVISPAAQAETAARDAEEPPDTAGAALEKGISAVAELCTRLARAREPGDLAPVLEDVGRVLHATGVTIWMWDPRAGALRPVLAHGYSSEVLARLPRVRRDADNAIAEAFRSVETRVVNGDGGTSGALVVPLVVPHGCAGVLALELRDGAEARETVRALATILAAQLSTVIECPPLLQAVSA